MKVLGFVSLEGGAAPDEVAHKPVVVRREEGRADSFECLLYALMAHAMGVLEDVQPGSGGRRHEEVPAMDDHAIDDGPLGACCSGFNFDAFGDGVWQGLCFTAECIK
jgi:hypothetical protein